ncbi:MAG: T9SS type A sorting domain-containing protein [Candidatus Marinimicrobia bacterium]|nr:T9SS type A sorting domain-containing protein [Candidatus Neomarinimicrobiota bacterium]
MKYHFRILTTFTLLLLLMVSTAMATLNPPSLGDTQRFNVFGHGFFEGYYPISATLQAMNDNTYIFVEDAKINDIEINANDPDKILLATASGVMYTDDGGLTWTHTNGSSNMIPEGTRSGGADAEAQHRSTVESIFFFSDNDWVAGVGRGHYALGDMVLHPPYRSKDAGLAWNPASSGLPNYTYENVNDQTVDRPTLYEMINEPSASDRFFAATLSGVVAFKGRKWETWPGAGLPQITAEWDHLPAYDVIYDETDSVITTVTTNGLYQGKVDFDNAQISWEPLGTDNVVVSSVVTYMDTTVVEYDLVTNDTTSLTFTVSVTAEELADGSYSLMVDGTNYLVDAYAITGNTVDLIVTTTTLTDSLDISVLGPRVYLNGDAVLTANQWVSVKDNASGLYWTGKARFTSNKWYVDLNEDNQYFANYDVLDPGTIDYTTWLPSLSDVEVIASGETVFSSLASDGTLLYAGSDNGIYVYNSDSLVLVEETAGLSVNDMLFANNMVLAGAETGLYQLNTGTWTKISPLLSDGYTGESHEYDVSVRSIATDANSNLYFGGPLGGLYKSTDNGASWSTLNTGLTHRTVTLDQLNTFKTAMNPTIFSDLVTWLGDLPDVDGDAKIYTLLMDIDDLYYNTAGDGSTYIKGEILTPDQYSEGDTLAEANSNYRDIIYVDINPKTADDPLVVESAVFQLGLLISHNADADEDDWVKNGLAGLGTYITGVQDVSSEINLVNNNSLTLWSDASPIERDYEQTFVFMDYLLENYFDTAEKVSAFMADTANGLEGLQSALTSAGLSDTFDDIYADFCLAIHFDGLVDASGNPFGSGKYNFANLLISNGTSTLDWGKIGADSPYIFSTRENSIGFFKSLGVSSGVFWAPGLGDQMVFNFDDGSTARIFVILNGDIAGNTVADVLLQEVTMDDRNWGKFSDLDLFDKALDAPGTYHTANMLIVTYEAGTDNGGSFVLHDLLTTPGMLALGVSQSVMFDEYIDIYGFADSRIFDDGGMAFYYSTDDEVDAELEGPLALVTNATGDTLYNQTLAHFHIDDDLGIFGYRSSFALPQTSETVNYSISLSGENLWGGEIASSALSVAAAMGKPGHELLVNSEKGDALLRVNSNSLAEESMITLISSETAPILMQKDHLGKVDSDALSDMIQIGPSNIKLKASVSLTISYDGTKLDEGDVPQIYELRDGAWQVVPGMHNASLNEIRIESDRFGLFQVRKAGSEELAELPLRFALHGNYPNPFNPSTTIRYELAAESATNLVIYNLLGQEIVTLVNSVQSAGSYSIMWSGENKYGKSVSSGVYLVQLNTDKGSFNHKIVYMK